MNRIKNCRQVEINGVIYPSMSEASRQLGIPHPTIRQRVAKLGSNWVAWKYIDGLPSNPPKSQKGRKVEPYIGAYEFKNTETGQFYAGSTRHLNMRKNAHLHLLRKNKHNNKKLQSAWNYTNPDDWKFKFYLTNTIESAQDIEQAIIDTNLDNPLFLNISSDARSTVTGKHRENGTLLTDEERLERIKEMQERHRRYKETEDPRRSIGERSPCSKPVIIDGIRYPTLSIASYETRIPTSTVRTRAHSKSARYSEYQWAIPNPDELGEVRLAKPEDVLLEGRKHGKPLVRPKRKGLYFTRHLASNRVWVGYSLTDIDRKSIEEYGLLRRGTHTTNELQELYNQTPGIETRVEYMPDDVTREEILIKVAQAIQQLEPYQRIIPYFSLPAV